MKTCMLALSLVAILGFTSIADAKGQGHGGMRGKIATVGTTSFTMTMSTHSKKNAPANTTANTPATAPAAGQPVTVQFTDSTVITINGKTGGKIDGSMVGKHVRVVGTLVGNTITATQITISEGHHKKAAA